MNCISCQAPLSMGFSKQEYWSGLPFPSLGESSWPRDQTQVSSIAGRFCTTWASREAQSVSQFSRSSKADSATPWTAACQASLSIINSWSLLKLMSIQSVMPSNHLILCRPLYLCLQSFLESGSFPISQLFASGGQSIAVSALAPVLPMNIQDWFPLGWTGWISLQSKGLSRVFSSTTVQKHKLFSAQPSL